MSDDAANRPPDERPWAAPGGEGLGTRPEGAPDMFTPAAPASYAPEPQPVPEDRPWGEDADEMESPRGPGVLLGVIALVVVAIVAVVGFWLIGGDPAQDEASGRVNGPKVDAPVVPEDERMHADEIYDGDWDFKLGDSKGFASLVKNWDHPDCSSAALFSGDNDTLIEAGCQYRIEGAFTAKDGHTWISEQVLVFPTESAAAEAASLFDWDSYAFQPEGQAPDTLLSGGSVDANKQYVIVTAATIDTEDEDTVADAEELLHYFHADHVAIFYWR